MRLNGTTGALAAGALSGNVLSGKQIELITRPSRVTIWCTGSVASGKATVMNGSETLMEESEISAANRFPVEPDDRLLQDIVMPLNRLALNFRNANAGANTILWSVEVTPVR